MDEEVQRILQECYDDAVRLLREHRPQLESAGAALLDKETLDEQEILSVTGLPPRPAPGDAADPRQGSAGTGP